MNADSGSLGGVYRSDDAGESWTRATGDERIWGRGDDFTPITVDPKNADIVYSTNVGHVEIHRRRQDVALAARRAGRR